MSVKLSQLAQGVVEQPSSAPAVVVQQQQSSEVVRICPPTSATTIDPSCINDSKQDFYEGNFVNNTDVAVPVIVGAGLGIAGAYQDFITTPSGVDYAAFLEDSRGAAYQNNAMSLQGLNIRVRSAGMILDSVEIQTTDATQAATRLFLVKMNNNLELTRVSQKVPLCDECMLGNSEGLFTRKFQGPFAVDINNGISYTINAGETVLFRLNIAGMAIAGNYVQVS